MKHLIFVILSALVFFTSCQKDEDVTTIDTQIPNAGEITTINASGFVSDENGNALAQTTVQLFNSAGELLGETTTDQTGKFAISELERPNSPLLIYAEKTNFNPSARKVAPAPGNLEGLQLQLASTDLYPQMSAFSPTSPDPIALNGQVQDASGGGVEAFVLAFINGELYNITLTDTDGAYQLIVPSEEVISIEVYQNCGALITRFEAGPFTEDEQLDEVTADALSYYQVSGSLLDCSGNPVTDGYALINWSASISSAVPVNEMGEFSLEISDCYTINEEILITAYDLSAGTVSEQLTVDFNQTDLTIEPITVCETDQSFVTLELDGVAYSFQPLIATVVEDSIVDPITGEAALGEVTTMIYQSPDGLNSFILTITGASNGTYFASDLLLVLNGQAVAPISSDRSAFAVDGTFVNHPNISGELIEGNFGGTFVDFTGQRTISGSFQALQQ
jgi:hypothetical protein